MRKELVIHINESGSLTALQSATQIRGDVLDCKTVDDIKNLFLNQGIRYTYSTYDFSDASKYLKTYHVMNMSGSFIHERNIYLINRSDVGAKVFFSDKYAHDDGRYLLLREPIGENENLQIYCGPNSNKSLSLASRFQGSAIVHEYILNL